jgi:chromosome segregation ATPase
LDFDLSIALERVNFILAQQKNVLLEEDLIGRHIIEILFKNNNEIIFPIREDISEDLLTKFVEIIFVIFNLDKEKRKSFYDYLRNIKKEIYKELSKKDIGDIFGEDDSTEIAEIKLNNSLKKNFPQELNNLLTDSLKIINKINMNNKDKEEVIQKVEKFQSALSDLITSLKEDNKKIKNEIKEKEKNFKKELEKIEDKINKEIKALKEDNEKIKKDNEKLKEEMKIIFSKNNNLQEQIVTLKNDSDNKHEQVKELVLNLKKIYENLLCPIDYALIKEPLITKK